MTFSPVNCPVAPSAAAEVLAALFDVSLTGIMLLRPLYDAHDPSRITDLAFVQLNPAAQRTLRLPACPPQSFRTLHPAVAETGVFAFYRDTFLSDQAGRYNVSYQHEGLDDDYVLTARRSGELLVVSFTDTADQDRSAVEQALRATQAREQVALATAEARRTELEQLFEQTPVGLATFQGPRHVVQLANPAVLRMWGRTRAQALGTPLFELLPEVAGQGFEELLAGVLATGQPYVAHELPALLNRDGRRDTVYFNFVYLPRREADGQITGVTVVATDVSEQVLARRRIEQLNQELALINAGLVDTIVERTQALELAHAETEAQRQRLHRLIAEAPALIASLRGPNHLVELANDNFHRIFGGRELVGKPYREAAPDLAGQPFFEHLDAVYRTGQTYFGTDEPVRLDRTNSGQLDDIYVSYIYQALHDAAGQVDGVLIFASEVTQQVLARQEREAQQQQLEELFMQAPAPIVILEGPELVFQLVNPAYRQIFPGRELAGKPLLVALPELADTPIPGLLRQVYDTGEPYEDQELPLQMARHEGHPPETIYWTFTYQAHRNAQGTIDGVRVFAHDVTAPVRARQLAEENRHQVRVLNQQLAALNDKLFAANAALAEANDELGYANETLDSTIEQLTRTNTDLDSFVYAASHDLRTPIANVEGLLMALREELPASIPPDPADPVQPLLTMMQGAVERFQTTLSQLGDIVRLQAEANQPPESVDLATLVADVRLDLAPQLAAAGPAQLTLDVAGCPHLSFAPRNLRSIVYNLLSNAVKYRHPDRPPVVHIRCRSTAATSVLEVEDNGLGLSATQQSRLFGLFRRLHNHVEGSGVGLYTLKRIVENAGGTISVRSELGVGSTFTVSLPAPAPAP